MSGSMKTILIIGGTSGIGANFAKRFHSMGKKVIVTGRRQDRLDELQKSIKGLEVYAFDMTDLPSVSSHVEKLFSKYTDIDTVWVNGGIQRSFSVKDPSTTSDERIEEEVKTNVTAPLVVARHVIPRLISQDKETQFMITSSGLGFVPNGIFFPVYGPTKSAVHAYMVGLRQALKDTKVNVIEIAPPYVGGTELVNEFADKVAAITPMSMDDFTNKVFKTLDENKASELKEVSAGTAIPRVQAWRSGLDELLASGAGG